MNPDVNREKQRRQFEDMYLVSQSPVMQAIERRVCGCDYGATSWTTRVQADRMGALLNLQPGQSLLDVGAGAGRPGLYLAKTSGCDVTMTDLTPEGLRIASARASSDPSSGTCWTAVADGSQLPFRDASFDAISHSDALCCLDAKQEVLRECRRVVRSGGRMVFTVISVAPGLNSDHRRRAVQSGPTWIEADADYPSLLEQTGWTVVERIDVSEAYGDTCRDMLQSFNQLGVELAEVMGAPAHAEKQAKLAGALVAIRQGWQRRELLAATPAVGS